MSASTSAPLFLAAKPVWQRGEETTMNRTLTFCADLDGAAANAVLYVAGASSYIVTVNGRLIAHGPQRCAHGYYRADALPLGAHLLPGANTIAIRVAGYNCNSFSYLDQPSFCCAEIRDGDRVLAYTAEPLHGFRASVCTARIQKVQRFSFQRTFVESYDLAAGDFACETGGYGAECVIAETQPKVFLPRSVPYGDYEVLPAHAFQCGRVTDAPKSSHYQNRYLQNIGPRLKGFRPDALDYASYVVYEDTDCAVPAPMDAPADGMYAIAANTYIDFDFGRDYAGIFEFDAEGQCDTLMLAFDELLDHGVVNALRFSTSALVTYRHLNGAYHFVCAEPYTLRYLRIIARGDVTIRNLTMRKIAFPLKKYPVQFTGPASLRPIFDAARETFAANAVDIFMDCPSRERAGWLCDGFFTGRVEYALTGRSDVERAFLENFLLPDSFRCLPRGVLPMCYPSDFYNGSFIPNWMMWYVLELREYVTRSGDTALAAQAVPKLTALDRYLRRYENEFGLLEHLDGWVFVEWSKANDYLQDVNFPSNMLYAGYKRAMAALLPDRAASFSAEADTLAQTIRTMARTGSGFFCDNAVRQDGQLVPTDHRTEACQYYAFFFDVATPAQDAPLWDTLCRDFGPDRASRGAYPEIAPANAFIGNYLRLDLLMRNGRGDQLLREVGDYFAEMAARTGTLWENMTPTASCNHGFASHILYWMDQLGMIRK